MRPVTKLKFLCLVLSIFLASLSNGAAAKPDPSAVGHWLGTIAVSGANLRVTLDITAEGNGLKGIFKSLDQGAQALPLDSVVAAGKHLKVELKVASASWEGDLSEDGNKMKGTWSQGGNSLPLEFARQAAETTVVRPQDPVKPYPYNEIEVSYENPVGGFKLGGTLTVPSGKGPFPAVLLITGSGQQNRNEELMGHKPFLVISDYLTRRGIAVLRVDDRGIGKSGGNFAASTTADFVTDVQAGVAFLRTRSEIDPKRIGLAGHSEGGVIAPAVAAADPKLAFIVLLAGTGVPGEALLLAQQEAILRASGVPDATIKASHAVNKRMMDIVVTSTSAKSCEAELRKAIAAETGSKPGTDPKAAEQAAQNALATLNSPWMRYFLKYDPAPALTRVKCPVLALNGTKDRQVPVDQNLPAIAAALTKGGNKDFKTVRLDGLNHLFQTCTTGSPNEYSTIDETFAPAALKAMGDWIVEKVGRK